MNVIVTATKNIVARHGMIVTWSRRNIITWSMEPPFITPTTPTNYYERPYSIVLLESSSLYDYNNSRNNDNISTVHRSKDDTSKSNHTTTSSWS